MTIRSVWQGWCRGYNWFVNGPCAFLGGSVLAGWVGFSLPTALWVATLVPDLPLRTRAYLSLFLAVTSLLLTWATMYRYGIRPIASRWSMTVLGFVGGLFFMDRFPMTPPDHPWHMHIIGYGALAFAVAGYGFAAWVAPLGRPDRTALNERLRQWAPVGAVALALLVLGHVFYTQVVAREGTYRRTILVQIAPDLVDRLIAEQPEALVLTGETDRLALVTEWNLTLPDKLEIRRFVGTRRGVRYSTLLVFWRNGDTTEEPVTIDLPDRLFARATAE